MLNAQPSKFVARVSDAVARIARFCRYGGAGKKSYNGKFEDYGGNFGQSRRGTPLSVLRRLDRCCCLCPGLNDVIGCYLDMEKCAAQQMRRFARGC
jgi:hypothetical protein